jgi:flagellar protein FliL
MSAEVEAASPKKKGGKLKKIILLGGGVLLLAGGGAAAGMYAAGVGLGGEHKEAEDPNKPKLVPKDGEHETADAGHVTGKGDLSPDPRKYKATYYDIEQPFTSNLRDSDGFVQIGLGVSTFYYDQRVMDHLKTHEMAVRSAILMTLADQDAFVITTPEGKKALQTALKDSINHVLESQEGFGGIDDVYFTTFIIQ